MSIAWLSLPKRFSSLASSKVLYICALADVLPFCYFSMFNVKTIKKEYGLFHKKRQGSSFKEVHANTVVFYIYILYNGASWDYDSYPSFFAFFNFKYGKVGTVVLFRNWYPEMATMTIFTSKCQVTSIKPGSMYGELTSISSMGSEQDSNLRPVDHKAQTLTTTPSCYPLFGKVACKPSLDFVVYNLASYGRASKVTWCRSDAFQSTLYPWTLVYPSTTFPNFPHDRVYMLTNAKWRRLSNVRVLIVHITLIPIMK